MPIALKTAIVLLLLAAAIYIGYASLHMARFRVEVCVAYHGSSACRIAEGRTPAEARQAAHDNACAQIASGVTDTVGCQDTPATSVRELDNH